MIGSGNPPWSAVGGAVTTRSGEPSHDADPSNDDNDSFLQRVDEWESVLAEDHRLCRLLPLEDHLESLTLETAARAAALEESSFSRYFSRVVGVSFRDWRTALRVSQALQLLRDTSLLAEEIALEVGFSDARSLRRAMNRLLDLGPAEFRRREGPGGDR
ncbi:MAG TPA: AraC family transcriptional regulator [Thermoanaerobaculia bacterium]|nr:AraC family transcriptional regulator [Thermoanaerobaculia bacterium]